MALLHGPVKYMSTSPSLQVSVLSNAWPSLAGKARSLPAPKKRGSPSPIICSIGVNPSVEVVDPSGEIEPSVILGRSSFPPGFAFGAGSGAYQVEGAWNEGGKGPSIWDTFTHEHEDKIDDKSNGDVATDTYHRYKEDIKIMKDMGLDTYRFSISWPRILPDGTIKGGVNKDGIDYYNCLINELIDNGITPCVTIFHWDVPQALEDKYGGFLDRRIVDDFKDFAKICFSEFGDRVKRWIILNEPYSVCTMGYLMGFHPFAGGALVEPYTIAHNLILAHAATFRLYKDHFQAIQGGEVGISLNSFWYKPYSETSYEDHEAAKRAVEFILGWFMGPLFNGDYPFIMRALVRERLPYFTKEESEMIKGSYDFIGINYYTGKYASAISFSEYQKIEISFQDSYVRQTDEKNGLPNGKLNGKCLFVGPEGLRELLLYIKERYNNPKIYITENGTSQLDNPKDTVEQACDDRDRIAYLSVHLHEVRAAMQKGVQVQGYYVWSLIDNFEWFHGYTIRFGLIYIDYTHNLKRYRKASADWYARFLKS